MMGREDSRRVITDLVLFTKARWIWIPKTVHREFFNVRRRYHRRETFILFLEKVLLDRGIDFQICPIYDSNRINEVMITYNLEKGEADAINQMLTLGNHPEVERAYVYYRPEYCFMTNERGVLKVKFQHGKLQYFRGPGNEGLELMDLH